MHVADNVGHNVRTTDMFSTFHAMKIIATVTPSSPITHKIQRINVTMDDVKAVFNIDIKNTTSPC